MKFSPTQVKAAAIGGLDNVKCALASGQVRPEEISWEMRAMMDFAARCWLMCRGEALAVGWDEQIARFRELAPPDLRDAWVEVSDSMSALCDDLLALASPGSDTVDFDAPGVAPWRERAAAWLARAEPLVLRLADPAAAPTVPHGVRRIGRGVLRGRLDDLMPCLVLTQGGGHARRWSDGGDTPGLFCFGEAYGESGRLSCHEGILLPLAFCRDPVLGGKLHALAEMLSAGQAQGGRAKRISHPDLRDWLDGQGLGFLRPGERGHHDRWALFGLDQAVFAGLLRHFDHVTAVLDGPGERTQVLDRAPVPWNSHIELIGWSMGSAEVEYPLIPFQLFLASEVKGLRSLFEDVRRRSLVRPNAWWAPFTRPDPEATSAKAAIRLRDEAEAYGWIELELRLGEQTACVTLPEDNGTIPDLLDWLQGVAQGDLPLVVEIDEEGTEAHFHAHAFGDDRLLLAVIDRLVGLPRAAAVVDRAIFLETFRAELARFLREGLRPDNWLLDRVREGRTPRHVDRLLAHPFLADDRG